MKDLAKKILFYARFGSSPVRTKANIKLKYNAQAKSLKIFGLGGYQSRNKSTIHLLLEGFSLVHSELRQSFEIDIYTCDALPNPPRQPHFAYCFDDDNSHTIAIPDFIFWDWHEVGIEDYEKTRSDILVASRQEPVDPRLFWIGNPETHPTRKMFLSLATTDRRIDARGMRWVEPTNGTGITRLETKGSSYVSLSDHCRYRYLLDLQGAGYSGRVKLLLLTGRTLFIQQRCWKEYFYFWLKLYEHYLPVREDLSDLRQQIDWAEANPNQAQAIAASGQKFALEHLSRAKAVAQIGISILSMANKLS